MQDEGIKQYLKDLQTKFCIIFIYKASFYAQELYVSKSLDEIGVRGTKVILINL